MQQALTQRLAFAALRRSRLYTLGPHSRRTRSTRGLCATRTSTASCRPGQAASSSAPDCSRRPTGRTHRYTCTRCCVLMTRGLQWIGEQGSGQSAGNLLRKTFQIPEGSTVTQAYAYVNGLGFVAAICQNQSALKHAHDLQILQAGCGRTACVDARAGHIHHLLSAHLLRHI